MSARAVGTDTFRRPRWCVLISGRGSNLASFLEVEDHGVSLVVSNETSAGGLSKARRAGVATLDFPRTEFTNENGKQVKRLDWLALDRELRARGIGAIFLLGFMRIVPASFTEAWRGQILNLHPSLLPKYPGLKSIERAIEARDWCGATVHEVVPEVDAGPIVRARQSAHADSSTPQQIETWVHVDEQRLVKETAQVWRPMTKRA